MDSETELCLCTNDVIEQHLCVKIKHVSSRVTISSLSPSLNRVQTTHLV